MIANTRNRSDRRGAATADLFAEPATWGAPNRDLALTAKRLDGAIAAIRREYLRRGRYPWVVAYSGGKDSTLLLQLTWEMLATLPASERRRKVFVVGNDTLVESPPVIRHLRESVKRIRSAAAESGLPIATHITAPAVDQTFWVNVVGRGYIPPTRNFRWCTDRMKILPTSRLLSELVRAYKRVVLLVGTRKAESDHRRRNMVRRGVSATATNAHDSVDECRMFAPLAELDDEDVWMTLLQRKPPWGGSHRDLVTLYRNAGGGECPLVLSKNDAPSCGTTSPRFGCWTCTVVQKDRSLRGLIDSGHKDADLFECLFDFREWLAELRENDANRQRVRRNGNAKVRTDGTLVLGPFTLEVRRRIMDRLRELENEVGHLLISEAEREIIEDIWREDDIRDDCRRALGHVYRSPPQPATI